LSIIIFLQNIGQAFPILFRLPTMILHLIPQKHFRNTFRHFPQWDHPLVFEIENIGVNNQEPGQSNKNFSFGNNTIRIYNKPFGSVDLLHFHHCHKSF